MHYIVAQYRVEWNNNEITTVLSLEDKSRELRFVILAVDTKYV